MIHPGWSAPDFSGHPVSFLPPPITAFIRSQRKTRTMTKIGRTGGTESDKEEGKSKTNWRKKKRKKACTGGVDANEVSDKVIFSLMTDHKSMRNSFSSPINQ